VSKQPLAIVTMVRRDYEMLRLWIGYYKKQVADSKSIYVIAHGEDQIVEDIAAGCSVFTIPFDNTGDQFEAKRRKHMLMFASGLLQYFQNVIVVDCDEIVAIDPSLNLSLSEYLGTISNTIPAISPIGFDVRHKQSSERDRLDLLQPILSQRNYGFIDAKYCKPCIIKAEITSGTAHRLFGIPWHIDKNLLLFHLKYADKFLSNIGVETRNSILEQYNSHESKHGIRGWENGEENFKNASKSVEGESKLFEPKELDWLEPRLKLGLKRRGVVPNLKFGPYKLLDRFKGII